MEQLHLSPVSHLRGELTPASDKSISHRGVMLGALSQGTTHIHNFLLGEDCLSTISCFRQMGVEITLNGSDVTIKGRGLHGLQAPKETLYTGNSGTTTRMLCGILAPQPFSCTINGDASIQKRPMGRVILPLRQMGAAIQGVEDKFTPLHIEGRPLTGIHYNMPVASAQLKSALLFAGLYAQGETSLTEPAPSRDHTERMIRAFGGQVTTNGCDISILPQKELYATTVEVPGDISSAAFFLVAGVLVPGSEILIKNVGLNPTRDGVLQVLLDMGADITICNRKEDVEPRGDLLVRYSRDRLHGVTIGGDLIPRLIDELPVLAVAAAFAQGTTVIQDAAELRVKESDRITVMEEQLKAAGVEVQATDDGLIIQGGDVHGGDFYSYGDHRVAMAMAVLSLAAKGESTLKGSHCISISYPEFFTHLAKLKGENL